MNFQLLSHKSTRAGIDTLRGILTLPPVVLHYKFISTLFGRFTSVRLLSAAQSQYNSIFFTLGFTYGLRLSNSFFSDAATSGLS